MKLAETIFVIALPFVFWIGFLIFFAKRYSRLEFLGVILMILSVSSAVLGMAYMNPPGAFDQMFLASQPYLSIALLVGSILSFRVATRRRSAGVEPRPPRLTSPIWRWIFICSLTSHVTLVTILVVQAYRGYPYVDPFYYPIRGGIVEGTLLVTTIFLLFISPFFFRRLGVLAILAWVYVLVVGVWLSLRTF